MGSCSTGFLVRCFTVCFFLSGIHLIGEEVVRCFLIIHLLVHVDR